MARACLRLNIFFLLNGIVKYVNGEKQVCLEGIILDVFNLSFQCYIGRELVIYAILRILVCF